MLKTKTTCLRGSLAYFIFLASIFNITFVAGNLLIVTDGNYSVGARGSDYWLTSGPFFVNHNGQTLDTDNGTLKVDKNTYGTSGHDKLGQWQDTKWILRAANNPNVTIMEARIRTYPIDRPGVVIFSQTFPNGLNGSRGDSVNHTISGFPTFRLRQGVTNTSLAYLMFAGYMAGDRSKTFGRWTPATADIPGGLDGSGPLAVYDKQGGVILISPLDHSMAASVWRRGGEEEGEEEGLAAWGVMGGVDSLPAGFSLQTLLYYGDQGVTRAFRSWGKTLRDWFGKTDDVVKEYQAMDITLTHLGYWTDNGAYYYYNTEKGKNYEETLPDVMSYASEQRIPYRYLQLDSWWYPKDSLKAVTTWDAMPQIFPHGLRNLSATLKLPIAAHNRYWSVNTTYAKQNGGQFDFFIGHQLSLPIGQEFWDWLMQSSVEWGLVLYEQDWLNVQLLGTELLQASVTAGADWLDSMARAAREHNVTLQYCMAQSRHALHSLNWPQVTQVRVSDDYHLYADNWKIGVTSHFAAALGLAPSKDTFWTSSVEPGNPFNKTEPFPELQSAVATLSTGPVGPGDAINLTDRDTLMRCCASDGMILKPSRPATAIDGVFMEMGFGEGEGTSGEVWSTYTTFHDVMTFGILLAVDVSRAYNVTPSNVGFPSQRENPDGRLFVRNSPHQLYNFSDAHPLDIGPATCNTSLPPFFCLFYTAPVLVLGEQEVILLGELEKWVPVSPQRVHQIRKTPLSLTLTLRGQVGETVTLTYLKDGVLRNVTVVMDSAGQGTVRITGRIPATTSGAPSSTDGQITTVSVTSVGPGGGVTSRHPSTMTSVMVLLMTMTTIMVGTGFCGTDTL
ncbi:uncharacterized protein LOC143275932 isoform X2 [Babylonia areolata]|uniref:uncharacterized protein LOC143275932 isoform X1 n=1 Tax=Babylonia areolata TaxID=304850 RepID=UPI003FD4D675